MVVTEDPIEDLRVTKIREQIFQDFENTVFREKLGQLPPKRGPLGEAVIEIRPGQVPTKQRAFQLVG